MKRVAVLGVTGSIGRQAIDVISRMTDKFRITLVSAHSDKAALLDLARRYRVEAVCLSGGDVLEQNELGYPAKVYSGDDALLKASREAEYDIFLNAVVGIDALLPTLAAIEKGARIALANKEMLVSAGAYVMAQAKKCGAEILPVDSEHSAIFQCLKAGNPVDLDSLILTSSGGAFRDIPIEELDSISPERALLHPNWRMGKKITIDCATMVNKGFEVVEAMHLFSVPLDKIEVMIHRESVVHSMVRFRDGSTIAQLSDPDMRLPIQYALTYPDRLPSAVSSPKPPFSLTFEKVDFKRYPCFELMLEGARRGGLYPAALLAADSVLVPAYLEKQIAYSDLPRILEQVLNRFDLTGEYDLADLSYINAEAEKYTLSMVKQ